MEERELQRLIKEKQKEMEENIYMLKNNIHYKKECIVDVDNKIIQRKTPKISPNRTNNDKS